MTERSALAARLDAFEGAEVLCVGDVMLDRFVEGEVDRISPEAPVPVLRIRRRHAMLGGAGNVARNLAALGVRPRLVAVVGDDEAGRDVAALGTLLGAELIEEAGRRTAIKTRYLGGAQQLLRADDETVGPVGADAEERIILRAATALRDAGAVVLSDYGKGALTEHVTREIIAAAREAGKPVVIDPKGMDYARYGGADVITPNRKELALATRMPTASAEEIARAAAEIIRTCDIGAVLATRGAEGMTLVEAESEDRPLHLAAEAREVFDVTGAGDTVAAAVAAGLAAGLGLAEAARIANVAAGIVVGKTGTAVARAAEVAAALHRQDLLAGEDKLAGPEAARERVAAWRRRGLRIGFTNGCFDLLHPGHVSLLAQARAACDRLVVGLNSDASARRLKGEGRPVQSEAARAAVLASLATVDLVVIFADDTPLGLIEALRPDVLVKGADYRLDQVVGADLVTGYGGRVLLAELTPGHSTTATIARMAK